MILAMREYAALANMLTAENLNSFELILSAPPVSIYAE
jgi:hypothetical protein